MDVLKQQIRRAQRRLALQRFLAVLSWCWFGALVLAAAAIAVDKFRPLGVQTEAWLGGALGLGLLAAIGWSWFTRRSPLEAALEIDRRFGLKERVSSTFSLSAEQLDSSAGRALVEDAVKRVDRLHVADQFRIKLNRWAWLPLAPAALAVLISILPAMSENTAGGSVPTKADRKAVKSSTEALRKKLIERRKEAREQGLKDAEDLFARLEQGTKELAKTDAADRKQALVKLNDLAQDLEKRRERLGGGDKLQEQLKQLKNIQQGPGDKLADSLQKGDFQQALKDLKDLRNQLDNDKLDAESKAQLTKQLEQMESKLKKLVDAQKKLEQDLKQQAKQLREQGRKKEANEIEKQLSKLAQQGPQMEQLKRMADKLGQCGKCMKQGDKAGAKAAMDSMQTELAELQQQADEMAMLEEALSELDMAKDSMNCKDCDGDGCPSCRGGDGNSRVGPPGMGMGRGRGTGPRPEEKTNSGFFDTKAKTKTGKGAAVVVGSAEGPTMKGRVEQQIQTEFEAAEAADQDPLTDQQLPRTYREHAKKYFDGLREGKK